MFVSIAKFYDVIDLIRLYDCHFAIILPHGLFGLLFTTVDIVHVRCVTGAGEEMEVSVELGAEGSAAGRTVELGALGPPPLAPVAASSRI